jgi:hypothetical protein
MLLATNIPLSAGRSTRTRKVCYWSTEGRNKPLAAYIIASS